MRHVVRGYKSVARLQELTVGVNDLDQQRFRGVQAFLVVFDLATRYSFEEAESIVKQIVRVKGTEDVSIVLAGNKCDLVHRWFISEDGTCSSSEATTNHTHSIGGLAFAQEHDFRYIETSAKVGINVEEAFFELVRGMRRHKVGIVPFE